MALVFPQNSILLEKLNKHPLLQVPWIHEKKIIPKIVDCFGGQTKVPSGVDMGLMLTLYDLNLGLPTTAMAAIQVNLKTALVDSAM